MTLTYKLLITLMIIVSVIVISLSLFVDAKTSELYEDNLEQTYAMVANQLQEALTYKLNIYNNMLANLSLVGGLNTLLSLDYDRDYEQVQSITSQLSSYTGTLLLYSGNTNEAISLTTFCLRRDFPLISQNIVSAYDCYYPNAYPPIGELAKTPYFFYTNADKKRVLALTMPAYSDSIDERECVAVIVMEIDAKLFFGNTDEWYKHDQSTTSIMITDDGEVLWESPARYPRPESVFRVEKEMPLFGWTLTVNFYEQAEGAHANYRQSLLALSAVLIILSFVVAYIFSRKFTANLNRLMYKMRQVEAGNLGYHDEIRGKNEIAEIDRRFNHMVDELNLHIHQNYILEISNRQAQMDALQNQINPHFLYNTLGIIDSIASVHGLFEISNICEKLGQLFRYNMSKDGSKFTTVEQEIDSVRNYIDIQKIRFGDRFEVFFDVENEVKSSPMLKFILQPLIENAITHAFHKDKGNGCIVLTAKKEDGCVHIIVSDNGMGFSEQSLHEVKMMINGDETMMGQRSGTGIGLANVIKRMKAVYGNDAQVVIDSSNSGSRIGLIF